MENSLFSIESHKYINFEDLKYIRKLYLPLIGSNSVVLFEYLNDIYEENNQNLFKLSEICSHLQINISLVLESFEKLEAVGLVETWRNSSNNSFIFVLKKPNDFEIFNKNPLLKTHLISIIGQNEYDKLIFENKPKFKDRKNFINISKKYQDVFSNYFEQSFENNENYSTLDLNVETYLTHDENVANLPSSFFIKYLMKRNPSYYENQLINSLLKLGFKDNAINLFIDFSFKVNDERIVCSYILKIAQDFFTRSVLSFKEVQFELSVIQASKLRSNNKKQKEFDANESFVFKSNDSISKTKEISIKDIFNDDEIKDIF